MKIYAKTDRLLLREILETDEDAFFELDSDPAVHAYLGNNPVRDMEQIRGVIRFVRQQYIDNGIGRWAMVEKTTNRFIGWTGLKLVKEITNNHLNFYDLGYRLIRKYWGQGYATEAAIASLNYGFRELNLTEIFARADSRNVGSKNVLEKSGLKLMETYDEDGLLFDWYRITKADWEETLDSSVNK